MYLLVLFVFGCFLIYQVSIKSTIKQKVAFEDVKEQLSKIEYAPRKINTISNRLQEINSILGIDLGNSTEKQELILDKISNYCAKNNINIKEIPEIHQFRNQDFIIESNKITIQGSFIQQLQLLYNVENEMTLGKVASVCFLKNTDLRSQKEYLTMSIYIQNIKHYEIEK